MDICDQIRRDREAGTTRCAVIDRSMSVTEAARAFCLADDPAIYRIIERAEADRIAHQILQTCLAHPITLMSPARAAELWGGFLALFASQRILFATNAGEVLDHFNLATEAAFSFNPATEATFDLGVIILGTSKTGCLWVEEED